MCTWPRPSVCHRIPTLLYGPGRNLGNGRWCPLVVHCWADLQSVHGFRCYDNIHVCKLTALYNANACSAEREMSASACTRSIAGSFCNLTYSNALHFSNWFPFANLDHLKELPDPI